MYLHINEGKGGNHLDIQQLSAGDNVYVIYRNPHTQNAITIHEATVTENPEDENELALFMHETYYPLRKDYALFQSREEAEQMYEYYFGPTM